MTQRDIVLIGASAGGIEALQQFVKTLPQNFPASLFVTVHFPENATSVLPRILSRAGALPAFHATDGEPIVPGRIYVAPPDVHLMLSPRGIRLVRGPKENGNRPSIDTLFRSAAVAFGPRVIGVVLTGNLDDGTAGLAAIKRRGGLAVVQDPDDALFPSMPRSALEHVQVDRVVSVPLLARTLAELMRIPLPQHVQPVTQSDSMENELAAGNADAIEQPESHPGRPSQYGCPDCGGVLWQVDDTNLMRFRCRVGHAWTADALIGKQSEVLEDALWTALRALEENASLARTIAERHRKRGADGLASRFEERAESTEQRARVIRRALEGSRERGEMDVDVRAEGPRQAS